MMKARILILSLAIGGSLVGGCRDQATTPARYTTGAAEGEWSGSSVSRQAVRIHHSAILIDGHNDLPWTIREKGNSKFDVVDIAKSQPDLHTDIPRLIKGGVGAQFWAAWVPPETMEKGGATKTALEQIDLIRRMVREYPTIFEMAYTADDIVRIRRKRKIASLIGVEGGHTIESSLGVLRAFYDLGVRYLTLTHWKTVEWVDAATDEARHGGLSPFGEEVVLEMNRLGMLVDISHISAEAMHDVLAVSKAPIIASHSSAYAVAAHPRNVRDDVLVKMPENGGVIMVNFYSGFVEPQSARLLDTMFEVMEKLREQYPDDEEFKKARQEWWSENPMPRGTVATVVDHIDHIVKIAGIDHVGIGSDYDGVGLLPEGLENVSCYPNITQELINRKYSRKDIHKILGGNLLRAMRQAEKVAADWDE